MARRDLPSDVAAAVSELDKAKQKLGHALYRHGRLLTDRELELLHEAKNLIADVMAALKNPESLQ